MGRPRNPVPSGRVAIVLPEPIHRQVVRLAEEDQRSVAGMVSLLVREALRKREEEGR